MKKVVVIGAGIGGLTTAAVLARAGLDVTVLEAHIYPGGCAGTFFHKQYRFDAGATLAGGFYPGGPMNLVADAAGISVWPAKPSDPAMVVHLPDGKQIIRYGDERRKKTNIEAFGLQAEEFWKWQENTADLFWDLALRLPPWPPQGARQYFKLARDGISWISKNFQELTPGLVLDLFRSTSSHLKNMPDSLRLFVDAQLLISAQTTSRYANAAYGASALDLPRRGVVHLDGGMGGIAETLTNAFRARGGKIFFRTEVTKVIFKHGDPLGVELKRGKIIEADIIVFNLSPWNISDLLGEQAASILNRLPERKDMSWGAFMVYVGLDNSIVPENFPLHHQIIEREPMGEGNTIFLSLSPSWDESRAPKGKRALTISTHTKFQPWWDLYTNDRSEYISRKSVYLSRIISAAERVLPGLSEASELILPGTPVAFERFTHRKWGWVGGFPQTNLFQTKAPRLSKNLWMVGDSIFPGQSTASVALGGIRVAEDIKAYLQSEITLDKKTKFPRADLKIRD